MDSIKPGDIVTIEGRVARKWWQFWRPRFESVVTRWVASPLPGELAQTRANERDVE